MTLFRHRWLLEAVLSVVLTLVLWSLFYAQLLSVLYKDPALLNRLVASDPLISLKQAFFYWQNPVVQRVAGLAALGSLAAVGLLIAAVRMRQTGDVFGDSRFMTGLEARGKGFRAKSGVILGGIGRDLLRVEDDKHVLVVGPTRSGKGVGFVIPNALSWKGSLIVLDIKRENHADGRASAGTALGRRCERISRGTPHPPRSGPAAAGDRAEPAGDRNVSGEFVQHGSEILVRRDAAAIHGASVVQVHADGAHLLGAPRQPALRPRTVVHSRRPRAEWRGRVRLRTFRVEQPQASGRRARLG